MTDKLDPRIVNFSRNLILDCLHHNEAQSYIEAMRQHLLLEPAKRFHDRFAQQQLSPGLLLDQSYVGIPHIWHTLRRQRNMAVSVARLWQELHIRLADDPRATDYLDQPLPDTPTAEQATVIRDLVTVFENTMNDWLAAPDGLEVLAGWIPDEWDNVIRPQRDSTLYVTDIPHPFTTTLMSPANPLPHWTIRGPKGKWIVTLIPSNVYRITVGYFLVRNAAFDRLPYPHVTPKLSRRAHALIGTELALTVHADTDVSRYDHIHLVAEIAGTRIAEHATPFRLPPL